MIAPLKVSLVRWIGLVSSAVLLVIVVLVRQHGLPSSFGAIPDRIALEKDKARLSPYGDDVVRDLRSQLARLRDRGALPDGAVPPHWRAEAMPPDASGAKHVRYVSVAAPSWSEVASLVGRLEESTGIVSLDIRSRGTAGKRRISHVEIIVPGTPGTTRRPAGATSPGAGGPDLTRTVGPGPSLRPPSAETFRLRRSAPAVGPPFAPFRPDPPGWAVVGSASA